MSKRSLCKTRAEEVSLNSTLQPSQHYSKPCKTRAGGSLNRYTGQPCSGNTLYVEEKPVQDESRGAATHFMSQRSLCKTRAEERQHTLCRREACARREPRRFPLNSVTTGQPLCSGNTLYVAQKRLRHHQVVRSQGRAAQSNYGRLTGSESFQSFQIIGRLNTHARLYSDE
ncbi:hypothetical protein J6590_046575 [Homalodisca vitripennis]|nr:hypothetical protein J6590_046575 [Homalodisca vitripennis]